MCGGYKILFPSFYLSELLSHRHHLITEFNLNPQSQPVREEGTVCIKSQNNLDNFLSKILEPGFPDSLKHDHQEGRNERFCTTSSIHC